MSQRRRASMGDRIKNYSNSSSKDSRGRKDETCRLKSEPKSDVQAESVEDMGDTSNPVDKLKELMKRQNAVLGEIETKVKGKGRKKSKSPYFEDDGCAESKKFKVEKAGPSSTDKRSRKKRPHKTGEEDQEEEGSSPEKKIKSSSKNSSKSRSSKDSKPRLTNNKSKPEEASSKSTEKPLKKGDKNKCQQVRIPDTKLEQGPICDLNKISSLTENKFENLDEVTRLLALHEKGGMLQTEVLEMADDDEDSDESDWEAVDDEPTDAKSTISPSKAQLPKEPVEITLQGPVFNQKKKKKKFDMEEYLRLQINRVKKQTQLDAHKVHLLCLLARTQMVNDVCNNPLLQATALSMVPPVYLKIAVRKWTVNGLGQWLRWFTGYYSVSPDMISSGKLNEKTILSRLQMRRLSSVSELVMVAIITLRSLGLDVRVVSSLQPITHKATDLTMKGALLSKSPPVIDLVGDEDDKNSGSSSKSGKESKGKAKAAAEKKSQTSKKAAKPQIKNNKPRKNASKVADDVCTLSSDDDFDPDETTYRSPTANKTKTSKRGKKVKIISSDSDENGKSSKSAGRDDWLEVYIQSEERWVCVDCMKNQIDQPDGLENQASKPVSFVVGVDNEGRMKDITRKYADTMEVKKSRADEKWWSETMELFRGKVDPVRDQAEEYDINRKQQKQPIPTSVSQLKGHPLYCMKRHLLKFEAIYPNDAVPVGYVKGEPVYSRQNVVTLHSKETWLKDARAVRLAEEPYKMVKARPKKSDRGQRTEEPTLPVYGRWQTEDYIPPPAVDGKVPRNDYGNIELFKPCMLPAGTVHLQLPALNKIARKLNIDCVPAMTGWDSHCGFSHPVLDGFVVCEEHKDILIAAWDEDQEIMRQREEEKREKRVYDNWRKLTRGLIIREKMKKRFDLQEPEPTDTTPQQPAEDGKSQKKKSEKGKKSAGKAKASSTKTETEEKANDTALSWPLNRQVEKQKEQQKNKKKKDESGPLFPFEIM